jgi:hypothetical protein
MTKAPALLMATGTSFVLTKPSFRSCFQSLCRLATVRLRWSWSRVFPNPPYRLCLLSPVRRFCRLCRGRNRRIFRWCWFPFLFARFRHFRSVPTRRRKLQEGRRAQVRSIFSCGVSSMDELQQPGPRTRVPDSPHHLQAVRKLRVAAGLEKSWFRTCEHIVRVSRVADSQIRHWRLRCGRRSSDE